MGRISQISTTVQAILRFVFSQCLPEAADHSGSQRPYGCETKFTSRTKHHVTIISKNYVTKLLCLFDYYKSSSPPRSRHKWLFSAIRAFSSPRREAARQGVRPLCCILQHRHLNSFKRLRFFPTPEQSRQITQFEWSPDHTAG